MVMAACTAPEKRMFVMELCKQDLFALLHSDTQLTVEKRVDFAIGAVSALYFLHSAKPPMLHRDIKSSNFLITSDGGIKLTDFGLCVTKGSSYNFGFTTQQADDAHKGTPAYMAPECLKTESFDEKSDVWSFGVVLWELITRKIPWEGPRTKTHRFFLVFLYIPQLRACNHGKLVQVWSPLVSTLK